MFYQCNVINDGYIHIDGCIHVGILISLVTTLIQPGSAWHPAGNEFRMFCSCGRTLKFKYKFNYISIGYISQEF